jgi:hypothetical protein
MHIARSERTLNLRFESGVTVGIDLGGVDLTREQLTILDKLASRSRELDSTECSDDHCPAQEVLEPDEFEKVRGLYVGLREIPVDAAGPIVDFCLHVINVHQVEQRRVEA